MPSNNLEFVRSICAAWERGDFSSTEWSARDIEFVLADGPDPRSVQGQAAMAAGWREFLSAWAGYRVQVDEYRELDSERILVLLHAAGRGKTSGLALGQGGEQGANLFQIANGSVTKLVVYFDHTHALSDLGLPE